MLGSQLFNPEEDLPSLSSIDWIVNFGTLQIASREAVNLKGNLQTNPQLSNSLELSGFFFCCKEEWGFQGFLQMEGNFIWKRMRNILMNSENLIENLQPRPSVERLDVMQREGSEHLLLLL